MACSTLSNLIPSSHIIHTSQVLNPAGLSFNTQLLCREPPDNVSTSDRRVQISKSEKKRITQEKRDKKKEGIILARLSETKFIFHNGMRFVKPYYHDHKLYAKERWYGSTLEHLFLDEFSVSKEYFEKALARGDIRVNEDIRSPNHILTNNDVIHHKLHRHEPPVMNTPIIIVADTPDILAIIKPSSIPIHPSGSYRHNTILELLASEHGYTSRIYPVHRIDRLTSGLLLIARGPHIAKQMGANMRSDLVEKQYLARVHGAFPSDTVISEETIGPWPGRRGLQRIDPEGKSAHTTFTRLKLFSDNTSLVLCTLKTGRTHQIRVHLKGLGFPIENDPVYGPTSPPFDYIPPNTPRWPQVDEDDNDDGDGETVESTTSTTSAPPSSPDDLDDICDFCIGKRTLLTDGASCIWLHALRYESASWKFETPPPPWAD